MKPPLRVATPPLTPVMLYDGDCKFCRDWITRWDRVTDGAVHYMPFQEPAVNHRFPELTQEQLAKAVHLVQPDGTVTRAAEAVFAALAYAPRFRWVLWLYRHLPGVALVTEFLYRCVATQRGVAAFVSRLVWGPPVERSKYFLARRIFLRLLGVCYLVAFLSLWLQLDGLLGRHGIQPVGELMQRAQHWAAENHLGTERYLRLPTICWFNDSDACLRAQCAGGVVLALALIIGIAPPIALIGLWVLYLSMTTVGGVFLSFQWDALLLETGLLAIFFAPWQLWSRLANQRPPSPIALWMLRALLFKLMLSSGIVKLTSGDPSWLNLTALTFHYETQPLPTWLGWYAHQLAPAWQRFCCGAMFGIELVVPFLIFAPRRLRMFGCSALVFLQLLIAATGNYCFFNLLTIALCVLLLDDTALRWWHAATKRLPWGDAPSPHEHAATLGWRAWLAFPLAAVYLTLTFAQIVNSIRVRFPWPTPLVKLDEWIEPMRSVNSYGLFRVMTRPRYEIIIEGSNDGQTWLAYEFKYKPGDVKRRPAFCEPHQPRLDWQMWFEALRPQGAGVSPWFANFCVRLLQGQREVLALLENNPFPNAPPRYLRATLYEYHFTSAAERRADRAWWKRNVARPFCPVLNLRSDNSTPAPTP